MSNGGCFFWGRDRVGLFVMPAEDGIQCFTRVARERLDTGFRQYDGMPEEGVDGLG